MEPENPRDLIGRVREARRRLAADGPPRVRGDGDFECVSLPGPVDGSHIFHNVFVDLFCLRELVRPGGLVILDDCNFPSVATAVRYFEVNTGWEPEPIAQSARLRAFRLPNPRTEPDFKSFKPFGQEDQT